MSETDKMSDEEKFRALAGIAISALQLGLGSLSVLAERGLIRPDEVEGILGPLLDQFDKLPDKARHMMPYSIMEGLAEVKRVAAANWKSNG